VSTSGNNVTLAYSITFSGSFTGSKNVYMYAASSSLSSGWVAEGTWTP
jgi:hypothetical protein